MGARPRPALLRLLAQARPARPGRRPRVRPRRLGRADAADRAAHRGAARERHRGRDGDDRVHRADRPPHREAPRGLAACGVAAGLGRHRRRPRARRRRDRPRCASAGGDPGRHDHRVDRCAVLRLPALEVPPMTATLDAPAQLAWLENSTSAMPK